MGEPAADAQQVAMNRLFYVAEGTANRMGIDVRAAVRLDRNGGIHPAPEWHGRQVFNSTSRVCSKVGGGEHVALVATRGGHLVARFAEAARILDPAPYPRRQIMRGERQLHEWAQAGAGAAPRSSVVNPSRNSWRRRPRVVEADGVER
jgi:hypothetical protein